MIGDIDRPIDCPIAMISYNDRPIDCPIEMIGDNDRPIDCPIDTCTLPIKTNKGPIQIQKDPFCKCMCRCALLRI